MTQLDAQVVLLYQMTELANRCLVGRRLLAKVDPDQAAHGARVVERLFSSGIGETKPVLQEVNPQHALDADGTPADSSRVGRICFKP